MTKQEMTEIKTYISRQLRELEARLTKTAETKKSERMYSKRQASERLGVSKSQIDVLIKGGKLYGIKSSDHRLGRVYIPESSLIAYQEYLISM